MAVGAGIGVPSEARAGSSGEARGSAGSAAETIRRSAANVISTGRKAPMPRRSYSAPPASTATMKPTEPNTRVRAQSEPRRRATPSASASVAGTIACVSTPPIVQTRRMAHVAWAYASVT